MANKAEQVIRDIFDVYMRSPAMLPTHQQQELELARSNDSLSTARQARIIADYIAGMTNRYALEEHERLFNISARP
jgi:dGTPase